MDRKVLLENMSWTDAEQAFGEGRLVIVPTGSIEQHGPHMPLGTDMFTAREFALRVAKRTGAIVAPVMPFGYAEYHADFPGTISLSFDNLVNVLTDVTNHLVKFGAKRILFVNGHGGNGGPIAQVGLKLRSQGILVGSVEWWTLIASLHPEWGFGHGARNETSLMMALAPELVDLSRAEEPVESGPVEGLQVISPMDFKYKGGAVRVFGRTRDVSHNGVLTEGNADPPAEASIEFGEKMVSVVESFFVDFAQDFAKMPLPTNKWEG